MDFFISNNLLYLAVILLAAAFIWNILLSKKEEYPYKKQEKLFSDAERSFLGTLEQAVGDRYRIFGKVRLSDVLGVRSMGNRKKWWRAFNKISSKHLDYVLCAKNDLSIVAGIELNDNSHKKRQRKKRDHFLVRACQAAGLPLLQTNAQSGYPVHHIREQIAELLQLPENSASQEAVHEEDASMNEEALQSARAPICPKCSSSMVRRKVKSGANTGMEFWGCSQFPHCRGALKMQ